MPRVGCTMAAQKNFVLQILFRRNRAGASGSELKKDALPEQGVELLKNL